MTYFTPFCPNQMKMQLLVRKYQNEPMYMSDEQKDTQNVWKYLSKLCGNTNNYMFEIGEFDGVLSFMNVVPEYRADFDMKFWNKHLWKVSFVRESRQFIDDFITVHGLKRLVTQTPDETMARVLRLMGFVNEGKFKYGFKHGENLKTLYQLRIVRRGI